LRQALALETLPDLVPKEEPAIDEPLAA